jgi:site-specific DNA-methyltransferase (adenine-specific)
MLKLNKIYNQDCFIGHKEIDDESIDLIYTDLPYGQTRNKWDSDIDLIKLWEDYKRIIKPRGIIILNSQGMFSAKLMLSNEKWWRYNLIWKKGERTSGFLNAKKQPMRNHEDIIVFYGKGSGTYNPQFTEGQPLHGRGTLYKNKQGINNNYGEFDSSLPDIRKGTTQKYPKSIINIDRPHPPKHPTQKPQKLSEWIIKTYTNPGDIVLDSTCGIGTTPIVCEKLNRKYIGFEITKKYYDIAISSINKIKNKC